MYVSLAFFNSRVFVAEKLFSAFIFLDATDAMVDFWSPVS
jgi:hypothetical protein